jgi:hypothetical protein
MTEEHGAYRTRCERSAEHLPLLADDDAYESLHMLTNTIHPCPLPPRC